MTGKEEYLEFIFQNIRKGKTVLFLGAGVSVSSGAPLTRDLVTMLHNKFDKIDKNIKELNILCEAISHTEIYGYNIVYEYLQDIFMNLQPSENIKLLPKYDWLAIFTTNYDNLIEQGFHEKGRLKMPKIIRSIQDKFNPFRRDVCHIVKLNGCATRNYNDIGRMAITELDIQKMRREKDEQYRLLLEAIKDGCLLFIGYSFNDLLALGVMSDAIEQLGEKNVPYSFALFPELSKMESWEIKRFETMKVIPIEETFEGFCEKLKNAVRIEKIYRKARDDVVVDLHGNKITIDENNIFYYEDVFHILNDYDLNEPSYDKEGFFRCTNNSWGAYNQHWDFERDYYSGKKEKPFSERVGTIVDVKNLKDLIRGLMNETSPLNNRVLFIPGIPGIGKTILAKRLAYDFYKEGYPIIFSSNWRKLRDYVIIQFFKEINAKLAQIEQKESMAPLTKLLIIVDDAAQAFPHLSWMSETLTDQNIPALTVCFDRIGEWNSRKKYLNNKMDISKIVELKPIDIFIEKGEKSRFTEHLLKIDIIDAKREIDFDEEISFFGLMYALVNPTQQRFHEIIRDQFNNLTEKARDIFMLICFIHQYNLAINIELISRVLGISWREIQDIIDDECSGIVQIEDHKDLGIISYRTHHRIIASKTIEFFCLDPQEQTEFLIKIFTNSFKKIEFERDLCHTIAINHLSQKRRDIQFTLNQLNDIFEALCLKDATSSLLHHNAIIKQKLKRYNEAIDLLKSALKQIEIERYDGVFERPNYILNTWGSIAAEKGFIHQDKGEFIKAEQYFKQASNLFHQARKINPSDSYPYFTEAYVFYRRGNKTNDLAEKIEFYSRALDILDVALSYVDETSFELYLKTKMRILVELKDIPSNEILKIAEELVNYDKNLFGYYIYGYKLFEEIHQINDIEKREEKASEILKILEKALEFNRNDSQCLNLTIKILGTVFPEKLEDIDYYYELLNNLFANQDYLNPKQMFEYGVICFKKRFYETARRVFKKLKRSSYDIPRRYMLRDILDDVFEGEIESVDQFQGHVMSTKPHIKFRIYFNPLYHNRIFRKGDIVTFKIGFNYVGPIAVEIKSI